MKIVKQSDIDLTALENSTLFLGINTEKISSLLDITTHNIRSFDKDEVIFHLMEDADRIGIIIEGRVEAQKTFPNGSRVNVSVKDRGGMIGPAAAFSSFHKYPCDIVAIEPTKVLLFKKTDFIIMLQQNLYVLENFTREISTSAYMLQQRLELFSYSGIAQKAAFYLLSEHRKSKNATVPVPESMTKWAMQMNVSRASLHRELKKLEEKGMIRYTSKAIEITDPSALHEVLG